MTSFQFLYIHFFNIFLFRFLKKTCLSFLSSKKKHNSYLSMCHNLKKNSLILYNVYEDKKQNWVSSRRYAYSLCTICKDMTPPHPYIWLCLDSKVSSLSCHNDIEEIVIRFLPSCKLVLPNVIWRGETQVKDFVWWSHHIRDHWNNQVILLFIIL